MDNNFGYDVMSTDEKAVSLVNGVMRRVYLKMLLAMLVTAVTAMYVSGNETILGYVYGKPMVFIGLVVSQILVVVLLSARIQKFSILGGTLLFYAYSVLTGVVFSAILLIYTGESVFTTFFITAGVFAAMSVYGFFTNKDLTKFGTMMFMALIGLIICTLVNMFMRSSAMEMIISFAGVIIFIGLTAWDTQNIKKMALQSSGADTERVATIGALELYLDFINIFLYLLRFFGDRK